MSTKITAVSLIVCLLSVSYAASVPAPTAPADTSDTPYNELAKSGQPSVVNVTELPELLVTTAVTLVEHHMQTTLNSDLYPTLHSALMAPFNIMTRVLRDGLKFYEHKSLTQMLSLSSMRSMVMSAPQALARYWRTLMDMEQQCAYRTICDLAAFMAPRLPFWANQLAGVYFTSHSQDSEYFRAVANGMINRNCGDYYGKCSLATATGAFASAPATGAPVDY